MTGGFRRLALACAAMAMIGTAAPVHAQSYELTVAVASASGFWTLLGTGINTAVRAAHPGSSITVQTTGGAGAQVILLKQGRAGLAIAHDAELRLAQDGAPPFRQPVHGLVALARLYDAAAAHLLLSREFAERHGIGDLTDLATRRAPLRVAVGRRGFATTGLIEAILKAADLDEAALGRRGGDTFHASLAEQAELLRDGRVDMITATVFPGSEALLHAAAARPVIMLPVPPGLRAGLRARLSVADTTIEAGAYPWVERAVDTLGLAAILTARADLPEDTAHDIVMALVDHVEDLAKLHRAFADLTPAKLAAGTVVPHHPGALRAFREAGLR